MVGRLVLSVLFILLNGFFVAAEFAFVKMRATQLVARVRKGERSAIFAQKILERLDRYLSVTQFGVTLASLGLGWVGEPAVEELVVGWLGEDAKHPSGLLHVFVIAIAFGSLTFAHILLGELVPKLVAIQRSERTALVAAAPLRMMYVCFKPLLWILEKASGLLLRMMGLKAGTMTEGTLSEEEILGILAANSARSARGKDKVQLLERVLRFSDRTARHAMVPRVDVFFLPVRTSGAEALQFLKAYQYSRVLLTKDKSLDHVEGYVYTKEFMHDRTAAEAPTLEGFRRDILFVPESQGLVDVLRAMQADQSHIAVVVDEYGGTSGIVTMEDLLEEIVGEIRDEFDEEPANIVSVVGAADSWDVSAQLTLDELKAVGALVEEPHAGETVGAVFLEKLGRLPKRGDTVRLTPNATATATNVVKRRITRVRINVASPESAK